MKILRNYILKDFFSAFIFSLLSLNMIMLLGKLMNVSDMVIRKGVNIIDAIKIFSFFIPYLLGFTLPLAFLLGILLCMGRLIADNEFVAMKASGISFFKILEFFLLLGVIFSLFLFILNDRVIPDFHYKYRSILKNIYSKNISALIEPGVFLENFQNHVLYVSDKEDNKLKNVFVYEISESAGSKVTFAKNGTFAVEGDTLHIKLEEGFRDETNSNNEGGLARLNFKIFFMDIPIANASEKKIEKKPSDMRLKELKENIAHLKKIGIESTKPIAEFHKRISFSFSIITFIILGFGVSLIVRHREKSINIGVAIMSALLYYLLFILGETLVEYQKILPLIGMWIPNIIITSIGGWLIYKNAHFR